MMEVRPIRNERDYDWALREIAQYFENEPGPGSPEADRFDVLATLIEAYESKYWPIDIADPIEIIRHVMEAKGLQQADLAELLQSKSRASELLARRRNLTLQQAALLNKHWGVPARPLLAWPPAKAKPGKKPAKPVRPKNKAA
jgi:HTH-type transcriptional regulator/antitoxin HigA